jgi:hypothetical protein
MGILNWKIESNKRKVIWTLMHDQMCVTAGTIYIQM